MRKRSPSTTASLPTPPPRLPLPSADLLSLGYIVQAHGLHGALRVHLHNQESDLLDTLDSIYLCPLGQPHLQAYKIRDAQFHPKGWLLFLEGIEDRTHAETQKQAEIFAAKEDLPPLDEGEFYYFELEGCAAFATDDGRLLGKVARVLPGAAQALLVFEDEQREYLVPLVDALVPLVDLDHRRIEIHPIDGLFDTEADEADG